MDLDADMIDWSWSDSSVDDEETEARQNSHSRSQEWRGSTPDAGSDSLSKEVGQRFLPRTMQVTPHHVTVEDAKYGRRAVESQRDWHEHPISRASSSNPSKNISENFRKVPVEAFKKALYPSSYDSNGESAKILEYRKRIEDLDQQWKQQTQMNAKMEELLRMQEEALSERDDKIRSLEATLKENESHLRHVSEKMFQTKHSSSLHVEILEEDKKTMQEQINSLEEEKARHEGRISELEEAVIERDEKLRKMDQEKLRLHELQLEEKDEMIRRLEAALQARSDKTVEELNKKISEQEAQIKSLQTEHLSLSSANSVPLEQMRMEAEQLQMAISIIEPKVHILDSQLAEISTLEQENKKHFYSLQIRDNAMQSEHEAMTKFLSQRESIIRQQSNELFQLRFACNEHNTRMEDMTSKLSAQKEKFDALQEELSKKDMRIEHLQKTMDHMQLTMDRIHSAMGERESRMMMLQTSLDQTQPAFSIAQKAIEERDMKIDAFQMLLKMGESQVQENLKALDDAMANLKVKDEKIKELEDVMKEKNHHIERLERLLEERGQHDLTHSKEEDSEIMRASTFSPQVHASLHSAQEVPWTPANRDVRAEGEAQRADVIKFEGQEVTVSRSIGFGESRNLVGTVVRANPIHADGDLVNADEVGGNIVLIERGKCTFYEKAVRATAAGAIGIIFVNVDDELIPPSYTEQQERPISVPIVCIRKSDARELRDGTQVLMVFAEEAGEKSSWQNSLTVAANGQEDDLASKGVSVKTCRLDGFIGNYIVSDSVLRLEENSLRLLINDNSVVLKFVLDGCGESFIAAMSRHAVSYSTFRIILQDPSLLSHSLCLHVLCSDRDKALLYPRFLRFLAEVKDKDGMTYNGDSSQGLPQGIGLATWPNGNQFIGSWSAGFMHGVGIFVWSNGDTYRGDWTGGVRSGFGTMESSSGTIYQGCWKDDVKHGPGVEVDSSGRKRYGIWLDGFQHARGVHVQSDGKKQSVLYNFGRMIQQNEFPHPQKLEKQQFQKCVATAKEAAKKAAQTASTAQQIGKNYLQISPSRMQSYLNTNLSP